jgi:putative DNA primase/helicase
MLRQVRRFLEAHGEGRFTWWHRAADDHNAKTLQRAGFRRIVDSEGKPLKIVKASAVSGGSNDDKAIYEVLTSVDGEDTSVEYFILPEVFRSEVCQGFDYRAVCKGLLEHGCLIPDGNRPFDCRPRLPVLGLTSCYRIPAAIFALDL